MKRKPRRSSMPKSSRARSLPHKQAEKLRKTREEVADRLAREETKHTGELATWIAAERMYLDVLLDRNLDKADRKLLEGARCEAAEDRRKLRRRRRVAGRPGFRAAEPLSDDVDEPHGAEERRARSGPANVGLYRREHRPGVGRAVRKPAVETAEVRIARRARQAPGFGKGAERLDQGRRRRQPLASGAGLSAGRAGQARRGDRAFRGRGGCRRTRPGRISHAGRLVSWP